MFLTSNISSQIKSRYEDIIKYAAEGGLPSQYCPLTISNCCRAWTHRLSMFQGNHLFLHKLCLPTMKKLVCWACVLSCISGEYCRIMCDWKFECAMKYNCTNSFIPSGTNTPMKSKNALYHLKHVTMSSPWILSS